MALSTIGRWFDIKKEALKYNLTYDQRRDRRQDIIIEEFAAFRQWILCELGNHLPKSPTRKAMEYTLGQWPGFDIFLEDGRVELSNNWVENAIRPVARVARIICSKVLSQQYNVVQLFTQLYRLQSLMGESLGSTSSILRNCLLKNPLTLINTCRRMLICNCCIGYT